MKKTACISFACIVFIISSFNYKTGSTIKARQLQENFVQVSGNLLLGKYEVSNGEYKKFISYLSETNQYELLKKCLCDSSKWLTEPATAQVPFSVYYHSHSSYDRYPVVAVSYFAATQYCNWLTSNYNKDPERKFKKVLFRLPTEAEWVAAANGGNKNKMYPWDKFYLRDKEGRFLCNYRIIGDQSISFDSKSKTYRVVDGMLSRPLMPAEVNAYNPNPLGLYNLSGNAAEMVAEEGLAKGGSFNDPGYDVTIGSRKQYNAPSIEVGFRVAMEIVER